MAIHDQAPTGEQTEELGISNKASLHGQRDRTKKGIDRPAANHQVINAITPTGSPWCKVVNAGILKAQSLPTIEAPTPLLLQDRPDTPTPFLALHSTHPRGNKPRTRRSPQPKETSEPKGRNRD